MHDGVAIAIKKNINYKLIDNFEEEVLAIQITTTQGPIIIATVYSPPRRPQLPANDLLKLSNYNIPVYILGDLNARHSSLGSTNNNQAGITLNNIINTGKLMHIGPNFYTFLGRKNGSAPDIILSNNKTFHNHHAQQGPLTGSDHLPIIFHLSTSPIQVPTKRKLELSKADWHKYTEILKRQTTLDLNNKPTQEIEVEIRKTHNNIKEAAKQTIPISKYKTLPYNKTTDEMRLIQTQYTNLINYVNIYGSSEYHKSLLTLLQSKLQTEYQKQSISKWNEMIETVNEYPKSSKEFWRDIFRMSGNSNNDEIPYLVDQNGNKIHTDEERENAFRREWGKIFQITEEENEQFDQEHEITITDWMNTRQERITPDNIINKNKLNEVGEITLGELMHSLRKFKEKAPGFSGITKNMILNTPSNIKETLKEIYNSSLAAGYFPQEFKTAKMIFIPKPNKDKKRVGNYRPISLLEITAKLFEKILNTRLLKFLEENNILNDRQHGFRTKKGTTSAIALATEIIAQETAQRNQVNIVLRDVSKAFDKVWHTGLQYKLLQCNLPTQYEKILSHYLQNRTAKINIGNYTGPDIPLLSGVPQGSCISPTLYILYTADTPPPAPYSEYIQFADDITQIITYPGKSTQIMANHTIRAIEQINKYEQKWKIKTNRQKFKIIPLAKINTKPIIINNEHYPYSQEGSMLGITINKKGYNSFMNNKKNKARNALTKIKRFNKLSKTNKQLLYTSLVRSVMEYPPVPIHAFTKTKLYSLQSTQNLALKYIHNVKYPTLISSQELHHRSTLEPINTLLYDRAEEIWNKIENSNDIIYNTRIKTNYQQFLPSHTWFPSSKNEMLKGRPRPKYK